jgi:hypothetical protein
VGAVPARAAIRLTSALAAVDGFPRLAETVVRIERLSSREGSSLGERLRQIAYEFPHSRVPRRLREEPRPLSRREIDAQAVLVARERGRV